VSIGGACAGLRASHKHRYPAAFFRVPLCSGGAAGHARRRRSPPALAALHLPSKSTSCQSLALCDGAASEKGQTIEPNVATRCQIWVNRVTLVVGRPLPVYPDQRTYLGIVGMSQRCQQPTSLIARPYGALDISIHFTKNHSFHVGKQAVALRQLQQVPLFDPCGKRAASSRSAFASSSHWSTVKCSSCITALKQSIWAIPNQCGPRRSRMACCPARISLSHSCHLKLCICGKLF